MTTQALVVAFGAGMVATVNPCGFAMLPAYLSYFLGLDDPSRDRASVVVRAVGVGAVVTGGFVVVFASVGVALQALALPLERNLPWITLAVGAVLVVLGIAMTAGYQPTVSLPKLERGGQERTLGSMFVFGVSYAIASLSCTLPVFGVTVLGVFSADRFVDGLVVFVAYGVGMGLVLTAVTVALALARNQLVVWLRNSVRYIHRVAGVLLVAAGGFLMYWAWWELRVLAGTPDPGGPADALLRVQGQLASWIDAVGPVRIGVVLALFVVAALAFAAWRSTGPAGTRRDAPPPDGRPEPGATPGHQPPGPQRR